MSRLIFVPRKPAAEPTHAHAFQIAGARVQTEFHHSDNAHQIDPLDDAIAFYCANFVNLSATFIRTLWLVEISQKRRHFLNDVEQWIRDHCVDPVLIQPKLPDYYRHGEVTFLLVFCDGERRAHEFRKWWENGGNPDHVFDMVCEGPECTQQILSEWLVVHAPTAHIISVMDVRCIVRISDDQEAIAFKLRWSDFVSS